MTAKQKLRIAIWTPLPPQKTGIADYNAEILPFVNEYFDLELFTENASTTRFEGSENLAIFSYPDFSRREKFKPFDLNVYHMGNNKFHLAIYFQALEVPGLVILHDYSISMLLYGYYSGTLRSMEQFLSELAYSEGPAAVSTFRSLLANKNLKGITRFQGDSPMIRKLVERSMGIMSHLEFCMNKARSDYGAKHAFSMYLGSPDPFKEHPGLSKAEARRQLGIPQDVILFGAFGHIQATKQNDIALRALAKVRTEFPNLRLALVGEINVNGGYDKVLSELINELSLQSAVNITGYIELAEMQKYFIACDVLINLRYPSFGQMSATLSRGFASGLPAIITDLPEWDFFPEDFCWRVSGLDVQGDQLASYMKMLAKDPDEILRRGKAAREFYLQHGTTEIAAKNLATIISNVVRDVPTTVKSLSTPIGQSERFSLAYQNWEKAHQSSKPGRLAKFSRRADSVIQTLKSLSAILRQNRSDTDWNRVVLLALSTNSTLVNSLAQDHQRLAQTVLTSPGSISDSAAEISELKSRIKNLETELLQLKSMIKDKS